MQGSNVANEKRSVFQFTCSLTPAATAAASAVEQTFTVTNGTNASTLPKGITLKATDQIDIGGPGSGNNVAVAGARANAAGQLIIQFINPTAGSLTHAAGTFIAVVTRLA